MKKFTLLLSCIDRPGIVATVSSFIHKTGLNILESNQFGDPKTGRFFMRVAFTSADPADDIKKIELEDKFKALKPVARTIAFRTENLNSWEMKQKATCYLQSVQRSRLNVSELIFDLHLRVVLKLLRCF